MQLASGEKGEEEDKIFGERGGRVSQMANVDGKGEGRGEASARRLRHGRGQRSGETERSTRR